MTSFVHATYARASSQCAFSSRAVRLSARALEARFLSLIMTAFLVAGTAVTLRALSAVTAFH